MIHAETILRAFDRHLKAATVLVLYGRAALVLGYEQPPEDAALSLDVDAILPIQQSKALDSDPDFWKALEAANLELEPSGLYLTHLFEETQVVLRPIWLNHLVPITRLRLDHLELYRPSDLDLLLTKMMRGADPQDMADARFIIRAGHLVPEDVEQAISAARVPPVPEIEQAFCDARPTVLRYSREMVGGEDP